MGKGAKIGSQVGGMLGAITGLGPLASVAGGIAGAGIGNFVGGVKNIGSLLGSGKSNSYKPQMAAFAKYGIEVEGGESVYRPDGTSHMFSGPSHAFGGIDYLPKNVGEFIFSDTAGYNKGKLSMKGNKTFADLSKKYIDATDPVGISMLDQLKSDNKQILKYGGHPKMKYELGGWPTFPKLDGLTPMTNPPAGGSLAPSLDFTAPTIDTSMADLSGTDFMTGLLSKVSNLDDNARIGLGTTAFKLPSVLYNIGKGLQNPDYEPLRLNREGQNAINIMSNLKYDPTQAYQRIREGAAIGRNRIAGQNISPFLANALNQGVTNNAMSALADTNLQGQQLNNQYRISEASTRLGVGAGEAAERIRQNEANLRNKAATNAFMQAGLNDIARGGDTYNKYKVNQGRMKEFARLMPYFAENFQGDPEALFKFLSYAGPAMTFTR